MKIRIQPFTLRQKIQGMLVGWMDADEVGVIIFKMCV